MNTLLLGACRARSQRGSPLADAPKDEVWLNDAQIAALHVSVDDVKLQDVDETVLAARDHASLASVRVGTSAFVVARGAVHDALSGQVAWIAGALDPSGRAV